MNRYFLQSSQSDRVRFDEAARLEGYDAARALSGEEVRTALAEKQEEWLASAMTAFHAAAWQDEEKDSDGFVEDLEEAQARWVSAWMEGFGQGFVEE